MGTELVGGELGPWSCNALKFSENPKLASMWIWFQINLYAPSKFYNDQLHPLYTILGSIPGALLAWKIITSPWSRYWLYQWGGWWSWTDNHQLPLESSGFRPRALTHVPPHPWRSTSSLQTVGQTGASWIFCDPRNPHGRRGRRHIYVRILLIRVHMILDRPVDMLSICCRYSRMIINIVY
jgi:hypothetical protein